MENKEEVKENKGGFLSLVVLAISIYMIYQGVKIFL